MAAPTIDAARVHCIGYAYASSPMACVLKMGAAGCYYLQSAGALSAHGTYSQALAAASALGTEPGRWSMDHPQNAQFLQVAAS
jgi:hypothetical protein